MEAARREDTVDQLKLIENSFRFERIPGCDFSPDEGDAEGRCVRREPCSTVETRFAPSTQTRLDRCSTESQSSRNATGTGKGADSPGTYLAARPKFPQNREISGYGVVHRGEYRIRCPES
jgi:hypothetical protein